MTESSERFAIDKARIMKLLDQVVNGSYSELNERIAETSDDRHIIASLNRLSGQRKSVVTTFDASIRRSERRLRNILESTPVGICITNRDRKYEYVNPNYCRLYGYEAHELIGEEFTKVVPDEHKKRLAELHDEFIGRRYELRGEWKVERSDGRLLDIIAEAAYIIDVDSQPKKVTFVVDITDRKLAERRLQETVEQLNRQIEERKRVEELKREVERIIRHDLRNPLNGILGAAQVLKRENLSEDQQELVRVILESGTRLNDMLDTSIDIVRMEEGQYVLSPIELELVRLLKHVRSELAQLAADRGVTVSIVENHPDAKVDGERLHLTNLFANLLRNAIEASRAHDFVTVTIDKHPESEEINRVSLHNDSAVPESIRHRFFERYVTYGKAGGTGIGTYVARLIARVHGGEVSLSSTEERGTTVTVDLPSAKGIQFR